MAGVRLTIRSYDEDDLDWLAAMNRALIDDSGAQNQLSQDGFAERFRTRAAEGYRIEVFELEGARVGFASHQPRRHADGEAYTHLAQFHIARERRRRGLGREAFALLTATRFPAGGRVTLDVRCSNPAGRRFWESLGFRPFSTAMEITLAEEREP